MNAPFALKRHLALALTMLCICMAAQGRPPADFYSVTATAAYRPVDRPGTQRRVAQTDAEEKARKQIYEYVGSMRYADGRSINEIINRDARLKAKILELVRNSETYDWGVNPACACVQVWVRLDLNKIRAALGECGY